MLKYLKDWTGGNHGVERSNICILGSSLNTLEKINIFLSEKNFRSEILSLKSMSKKRDCINLSTVEDYKGLESPIVCLFGRLDENDEFLDQYIYKGFSRANHTLLFIASKRELDIMKNLL